MTHGTARMRAALLGLATVALLTLFFPRFAVAQMGHVLESVGPD